MYPQPSVSPGSAAFLIVAVMAISAIAAIGIAAWLARDIARRAIERAEPDKVPAVLHALAAMLEPFANYLPWSGQRTQPRHPNPDGGTQITEDPGDPKLRQEDDETRR